MMDKQFNIKKSQALIKREDKLKQMDNQAKKNIKTADDVRMVQYGYLSGLNKAKVSDEKMANPIFKASYERGIRFRTMYEYKQKVAIIEKMVENNIDFSEASEDIRSDNSLYTRYLMLSIKKDALKGKKR